MTAIPPRFSQPEVGKQASPRAIRFDQGHSDSARLAPQPQAAGPRPSLAFLAALRARGQ